MKFLKFTVLLFVFLMINSCQRPEKIGPTFIQSQYEARHSAPFSDATEYGGLLFLTGQIGKDHKAGKMVEGGIQAETRQVLTNIKDVVVLKRETFARRWRNVEVRIGNTATLAAQSNTPITVNTVCNTDPGNNDDFVAFIRCNTPLSGRYLTLQIKDASFLEADEVYVYTS